MATTTAAATTDLAAAKWKDRIDGLQLMCQLVAIQLQALRPIVDDLPHMLVLDLPFAPDACAASDTYDPGNDIRDLTREATRNDDDFQWGAMALELLHKRVCDLLRWTHPLAHTVVRKIADWLADRRHEWVTHPDMFE